MSPDRIRAEQMTVLVVERDAALRTLLHELLAEEGYAVLEAPDDRGGLSLAREHRPSVILLDLGPWGATGLGVLDALRRGERTRYIPVVAITTAPVSAMAEHPSLLRKPFDISELLAHVGRAVRCSIADGPGVRRATSPPGTAGEEPRARDSTPVAAAAGR